MLGESIIRRKNRFLGSTTGGVSAAQQQLQQKQPNNDDSSNIPQIIQQKRGKRTRMMFFVFFMGPFLLTVTSVGSFLGYHSNNNNNNNNLLKATALNGKTEYHADSIEQKQVKITTTTTTATSMATKSKNNNASKPKKRSIFDPPTDLILRGSLRHYHKVPPKYYKTFCLGEGRVKVAKFAFSKHGWTRVDCSKTNGKAHVVYHGYSGSKIHDKLLPWQRFSRIPNSNAWEHKNDFLLGLRTYAASAAKRQKTAATKQKNESSTNHGILYFLPETYLLYDTSDRQEFFERLHDKNGMNQNWVLKNPTQNNGKGIEILGANSLALQQVLTRTDPDHLDNVSTTTTAMETSTADKDDNDSQTQVEALQGFNNYNNDNPITIEYLIQAYVCNELTWFEGQKFDLRFYWFVASVDPPIVLLHDGYARVSRLPYQEHNFSDTGIHLTNHKHRNDESIHNVSASDFWNLVNNHYNDHVQELQPKLPKTNIKKDPVLHVKNQMKQALGMFSDAFLLPTSGGNHQFQNPAQSSTTTTKVKAENGFGFYGCDFIIDNDLDVYFIESQAAPGFDLRYPWRQRMFQTMFDPIPLLIEEIQTKQIAGKNMWPLENLGSWEVVRAGDWVFEYHGYQRQPMETKKQCLQQQPTKELIMK